MGIALLPAEKSVANNCLIPPFLKSNNAVSIAKTMDGNHDTLPLLCFPNVEYYGKHDQVHVQSSINHLYLILQ